MRSNNWTDERNKKLLGWFGGNAEAVHFLLLLSDITELWDDLIDGDVALGEQRVNDVFWRIMVELPTNPFFDRHKAFLMPLIIMSINSWLDANRLQAGNVDQRALAYTLRNMDIIIAQAIVFVTQGRQRMREVSAEMWDFFGARQDDALGWILKEEGRQ